MTCINFFHSTPYHSRRTKTSGPVCPNASDPTILYASRKGLAQSINFYGGRLAKFDSAEFKYLHHVKRTALEEELLNTFYLLYDECRLHALESETLLLRQRAEQMDRCAYLLHRLRNTPALGEQYSPEQRHQMKIETSQDMPGKYVALTIIAPLIAQTMLQLTMAERLENIKDQMSEANLYRLNWVWGGGLDSSIFDLIPTGFQYSQNARNAFANIAPFTGYMSWVLYYCRLGIELCLLTKSTLKGSWMDPWRTEADRAMNIGLYRRFTTQIKQRKFALLNDAFWATANMACFVLFIGKGIFGYTVYMGNAITAALLVFDLILTTWQYIEKSTEHNQLMHHYHEEITLLKETIDTEEDDVKKAVLNEHLHVLCEAKEECAFDWVYADKQFKNDLLYASGLFIGFSILCGFFFPPAAFVPSSLLILALVGSALSFLLTVAYHAWTTSIEIEKIQALDIKTTEEINRAEETMATLVHAFNHEEDAQKKQPLKMQIEAHQLKISNLLKELNYQQDMVIHHKKEQTQQIISEAMMPVAAFAFLVFMPFKWGLALLVPTVTCLLMSGSILDSSKPNKTPPEAHSVFCPSST